MDLWFLLWVEEMKIHLAVTCAAQAVDTKARIARAKQQEELAEQHERIAEEIRELLK